MRPSHSIWLALIVTGFAGSSTFAQNPAPTPMTPTPMTVVERPTGTAATVNGQAIPEVAVYRRLRTVPAAEQPQARAEIINYLVDLVLIDQYLVAQKFLVEPKEIDDQLTTFKDDLKKAGQDYAKFLMSLVINEDELKQEIAAELRWEKFLNKQATDEVLKKLFEGNVDMFDGSKVRARHILLSPNATDPTKVQEATAMLKQIKTSIEAEVAAAVAKLPATADALAREQERCKTMDALFAGNAREKSSCPSKRDGGDLNWFHRAGSMVEPFAKAAFALKPFQITEPIQTQFGVHLIMVTARQPGQPTKFEEVKEAVRETYEVRLREAMATQLRDPMRSKIQITPVK